MDRRDEGLPVLISLTAKQESGQFHALGLVWGNNQRRKKGSALNTGLESRGCWNTMVCNCVQRSATHLSSQDHKTTSHPESKGI